MKKLTLILVVLLTIGLVGAFAESSFSMSFNYGLTVGDGTGGAVQAFDANEINFSGDVDDNTTLNAGLEYDGGQSANVDEFYAMTDFTGALGLELPVTVTGKVGWMKNWWSNFATITDRATGHDRIYAYAPETHMFTYGGGNTNGEIDVEIAMDMLSLHYRQGFDATNIGFGASSSDILPMDGMSYAMFLNYQAADVEDLSTGQIRYDSSFSMDVNEMVSVQVPVNAYFDLDDAATNAYAYGSGVKGTYDMASLAVAFNGNETEAFQEMTVQAGATPVEGLDVYAIGGMDFAADDAFQYVDLGGSYAFGGHTFKAGYMVEVADGGSAETGVMGDTYSVNGSGPYVGFSTSF